jgi:hypothetical protein
VTPITRLKQVRVRMIQAMVRGRTRDSFFICDLL